MALNNTTADAVATAITSALGLTSEAAAEALPKWKEVVRALYAALKTDVVVSATIPLGAIATAGTAAAQSGPPAPVPISGTVA